MLSRLLAPLAAILLSVSSAIADPLIYELVSGDFAASEPDSLLGSFEFPAASLGTTSLAFSSVIAYDISIFSGFGLGTGWHSASGDPGFSTLTFNEVIGSPILTGLGGEWFFTNQATGVGDPGYLILRTEVTGPRWHWKANVHPFFGSNVDKPWQLVLRQSVTVPVPEPASLLLLTLAGAVMACRRCRRGARSA